MTFILPYFNLCDIHYVYWKADSIKTQQEGDALFMEGFSEFVVESGK